MNNEQSSGSGGMYALIGCAGLLVLGLCGATAFGVFMVAQRDAVAGPGRPAQPIGQPNQPIGQPNQPIGQPNQPSGGPMLPGNTTPRMVTATVSAVTGSRPVPEGAICSFAVERHAQANGYWCRSQVVCAGQLLYGGANSGYFNCTLHESPRRDVVGADTDTTATDTDAAFEIDTQRGFLRVRDDAAGIHGAFSVEARVTQVH